MRRFNAKRKGYPKKNRFLRNASKFAKGVGQVAGIAGKALSVASAIAGVINAEHKHIDTIYSGSASNATPVVTCLTNMAQGVTDQTRTGNSILAKHIYIKGQCEFTANDVLVSRTVRVICLVDTNDENDVAPTIDLILQNYSTTYVPVSMHNKNYTDRFRILFDQVMSGWYHQKTKAFSFYKEFKVKTYTKTNGKALIRAHHCTFNGPLSTDLSKNHIYMVTIGNADTLTPTLTWHARFGYVDN